MALIIHVDGGARGNPGPAGAGVLIRTDAGERIHEAGYFLGRQTNNFAEYTALIRAVERAQRCAAQPLRMQSDSQLLVRQLTGEYQVKSPAIAPLFRQAQMLLLRVANWSIRYIPREENSEADRLANLAMDQGADVIVFDIDDPTTHGTNGRLGPAAREASIDTGQGPPATVKRGPDAPGDKPELSTGLGAERLVRIQVVRAPAAGACPAMPGSEVIEIGTTMPGGLCVHAAHALLPTVLAIINTAPQEYQAVPTMTVRCSKLECAALFNVGPQPATNGAPNSG